MTASVVTVALTVGAARRGRLPGPRAQRTGAKDHLGSRALWDTTSQKAHPSRRMTSDSISTKLARLELSLCIARVVDIWSFQDGWGAAMHQRTFRASVVAFVLGLLISLAWSFLHAYGL